MLSRSLPGYFAGPERVGVAITGGLDTRVIMALHRAVPSSVPCYTFGGMFRECQDVQFGRKVAQACQQTHQVITVGNEFLTQFPHYAERSIYLSEGGVDVYRASDLYVSERAREIAPAKVVGTYGSEIVRHAVMFKPITLADRVAAPGLYGAGEAGGRNIQNDPQRTSSDVRRFPAIAVVPPWNPCIGANAVNRSISLPRQQLCTQRFSCAIPGHQQ